MSVFSIHWRVGKEGHRRYHVASNSVRPQVRTDQVEYAQFGTTLENLYVSRLWKPGRNLYARATTGLFESMYGGVSGEVLWKPVNSRLGLGLEANYVVQRDFDQRFGFIQCGLEDLTQHPIDHHVAKRFDALPVRVNVRQAETALVGDVNSRNGCRSRHDRFPETHCFVHALRAA